MRRTVLFICHNHPSVRPGGAETYAYEVFLALRNSARYEPVFLAKGGPPIGYSGRHHEGTLIAPVGALPDEYFIYTDGYTYDWLNGSTTDKDFYTHHLAKFLSAVRPDVVHVQHANFIGYDMLRAIRNVLPDAAIVYTLHEYMSICHRDGQMLRTTDDALCLESSPRRCHECFPDISPQRFFMRKRFIQSHLSLVDHFISPSRFLIERYVDWGLPRDRISFEENGRVLGERGRPDARSSRNRFGFFGQVNAYKGLDVLLEAFQLIGRQRSASASPLSLVLNETNGLAADEPHLYVHGANLDLQSGDHQGRIAALAQATRDHVTWIGRYEPAQLAALMDSVDWVVVPSIWWENAPLVIQEAFHYGRPVICSDIGGMAEKVADGVDGLHFRARDPRDLADVIRRAVSTPGLWDRLHAGTSPAHKMDKHVLRLVDLYDDLINERRESEVVHVRR